MTTPVVLVLGFALGYGTCMWATFVFRRPRLTRRWTEMAMTRAERRRAWRDSWRRL